MLYLDGMPTGLTIYTIIRDENNKVYNGTSYVEPYVVADLASYAVPTAEDPAGSGNYACDFPAGSPAGNYRWSMFIQSGGTPSVSDMRIGSGADYWNGTSFGSAPVVLAPDGMDNVIAEEANGDQPAINARVALGLIFDAAPGGLVSGVQSTDPIQVMSPNGVLRMTIEADENGNRTRVTFNDLP